MSLASPLRFFACRVAGRPHAAVADARFAFTLESIGAASHAGPGPFEDVGDWIRCGGFTSAGLEVVERAFDRAVREGRPPLPDRREFLPPVRRPEKILCVGRNYRAHAAEMGHDVPEDLLFFAKLPSCLIASGEPIVIPRAVEGRVDEEGEILVVIGREGRDLAESEAASLVAGYTCFNDVTARALQKEDAQAGRPWLRSKSADTFGPSGPYVLPAACVPDPGALHLRVQVNGTVRQEARAADLVFPVPAILARLSRLLTLRPGDLVATGTPAGVTEIADGYLVEVEIEGIGCLSNPVRR